MDVITYKTAKANLAKIIAHVCNDHAPIIVTHKTEDPVVMMPLKDYYAMQEAIRVTAKAEVLLESIAEFEADTEKELLKCS